VIHARDLTTTLHRKPSPAGYGEVCQIAPDETRRIPFAPDLDIALAILDLV
jgi:hypothetical protein